MSDRNGISRLDAGIGLRLVFFTALFASFLMCSSACALGLVEYYGEKVMYVPLTEISSPHYWSFELQNNGDTPVDVAILVTSPLVYLENQLVTVQPYSSQKITFTVYLPSDVHYALGDFADVSFEVAYVTGGSPKNVVLKKGLTGYMGIIVGQKGQQPVRDIHGLLKATGKPMESFRLADNEKSVGFYEPVAVTGLPVPPPAQPIVQNGGNLLIYIVGSGIIIMVALAFILNRKRSSGRGQMKGFSAAFLFAFLLFGVPSVLADSGSGYQVSAEILNEAPITQMMVDVGGGISGMLVGITNPLTLIILTFGIIGAILIIFYGFADGIRNAITGRYMGQSTDELD
jgi:hypothetical protein